MTTIRNLILCGATAGSLAIPMLAVAAQPESARTDAEFVLMDTNKDGKVSSDEHGAGARKMFVAMDSNQDGKVTAAEMDAAQARMAGASAGKPALSSAQKIKVVDTDGDGILTAQEHAAGSHAMFVKMDADKNGFLTKEELAAGHAGMMK